MYKNKWNQADFDSYINGETIAFYSYDLLVKNKVENENEYVDVIANTYCGYHKQLLDHIPDFYDAMKVLKNDYNTDIYELPFRYEIVKQNLKRYDLIKQLENYFDKENIKYTNAYYKGQELQFDNPVVEKIIDEIDDIDMDTMTNDYERQVPI